MARREITLALAGAGIAAVFILMNKARAAQLEAVGLLDDARAANEPGLFDELFNIMEPDLYSALQNRNVLAFLAMIGEFEGGPQGYNALFGGGRFDSFDDHPRTVIDAGGYKSSAAGKYQILQKTWDDVKGFISAPDFSPYWQDVAAIYLIRRRGALADVMTGNFDAAIAKLGREWASLPGSPYGQPMRSIDEARTLYADAGGSFRSA